MADINPSPLPPGYQPAPFGYEVTPLTRQENTGTPVVLTLRTIVGSTTVVFGEDECRGFIAKLQEAVGESGPRIEIARNLPPAPPNGS